jgi:hypothetical protein
MATSSMPRTAPAPTTPVVTPDADERLRDADAGDHDRFTHYVRKRELERSRLTGRPVRALCGKRWVPDGDPSRYPMCPTCAELVADAMSKQFG